MKMRMDDYVNVYDNLLEIHTTLEVFQTLLYGLQGIIIEPEDCASVIGMISNATEDVIDALKRIIDEDPNQHF